MKKNRHWLLTMAMLLSSIMVSAHDFEVDGIYYNILSPSEKTVQVTWKDQYYQTYTEYKGDVVIPSTVTYNDVSYSVAAIQYDAFRGCNTLTSVTIPETVTEIKSAAFRGTGLTSIFIPKSVTSIEGYVFHDCGSLASIVVDDENAYYDSRDNCNAIINKSLNRLDYGCSNTIIPTSVKSISSSAFMGRTNLTTIVIPDNITYLLGNTFEGCSNLVSVTLSNNLNRTGSREFYGCNSLKSITIPESLTEIKAYTFYSCSSLASIEMPSSITYIDDYAFSGCSSLKEVHINDLSAWFGIEFGYDNIGANPLCCGGNLYLNNVELADLVIPENVSAIPANSFAGSGVTSVTFHEGVKSLSYEAFKNCKSLTSVIALSPIAPTMGSNAFKSISSSAVLTIPSGSTSSYEDAGWTSYFSSVVEIKEDVLATSLALDITEASLAPNETLTLTATLLPEDVTNSALSWTSSNESVATVDANGVVTTVADGEATITVSTTDGSELSASCKVTVKTNILATSLALDVTGASSAPNETLTLTATLLPEDVTNPALSWTSSNEAVATVDANGVVTAVADGEATITVSTTDGSELSASCKVTVKTNILATSLALDVTEASLAPNETLLLTATLLPEDVTNPLLSWSSSNESVATVDANGVVTAVADGEATITVSTTDGSDLSASCKVVVVTEEVVEYDNMIYFEDVTVFTNSSVSHPLQLKNTVDMTAVQFDLYLPEGVSLATDARGRYAITFNADRADNTTHTLSSALQSDGAIRVLCYSTESYEFLGSEGAIFYFPLEIAEMEDGDYDMVIKNIVLTDVSGKKYEIPSMTSTITVLNVAPGDCNADNTIDVADIVVLANHILGNTADGFVEKAADYNTDGAVDVADIVNIANYILNGNNAAARALVREIMSARAAAAGYSFDILPFVLDAAGSKTIAIELTDPTESFTAFQCDLYLPEGVSVDKDKRGRYAFSFNEERTDASCHTLSSALQADGAIRVLCYSANTYNFLGTEGALLNIPLTAETSLANGVYEFTIANTVLTYVDGVKVMPETYKGSIVVGDGGEVKEVKLYGRYTSEVLYGYTAAFGTNAGITSLDLTEALYLPADGSLTTGNPNTIVYLAEGDALANENNVVVGDECANLMLADGYAFSAPVAFNASQASYERELAEGKYGTIVLPFAPNTDDYVFYALTSVGDDALIFDEVQSPVANTPYLYKLRDGKSATQITNNEVAVSSELTPTETATWQMVGSFTNQTIAASEDADTYYYVYTSSDNQLHKVTNTLTVKPYRAYFTTNSTNGTQLAIRTRGGEETLIDATEVEGLSPEVYYDLSGRRVDNPVKGVYIVNDKKVVF